MDVRSEDYRVARRYMVRLEADDFARDEWFLTPLLVMGVVLAAATGRLLLRRRSL